MRWSGKPRIVIVGAGGWVFPVELARDILSFGSLAHGELVLYDIDVEAAERTARAVRQLIEIGGLDTTVEIATELPAALRGADFVVTVFQVGGVKAYAHDIEIPREYGVDQIVGDTLGPGGVFRGLRTIEALRVVAETMLEVCPDALLLNYTNPMSANIWATDLRGVRVIGLCHSVQNTAELLAHELGVPLDEVTFDTAGVNHTAWFTTFTARRRGPDPADPRGDDGPLHRRDRAAAAQVGRPVRVHRAGPRRADAAHRVLPHRVQPSRQRVLGVVPPHARAGQPLPGPALGQPGDRHHHGQGPVERRDGRRGAARGAQARRRAGRADHGQRGDRRSRAGCT